MGRKKGNPGAPGPHQMEPERRMIYEQLLRTRASGGEVALNLRMHRYASVVKYNTVGVFSNLRLACKTVDISTGGAGLVWEPRPRNLERNYVLDTGTGQTYIRVVRGSQPAEERGQEGLVDGVLEAAT